MRSVLVLGFLALGLWRAVLDWQATIAQGYAYRFTSIDRAFAEGMPGIYTPLVQAWQNTSIPLLWDPFGRVLLGLPLTLVCLGIAVILWFTRHRARGRG